MSLKNIFSIFGLKKYTSEDYFEACRRIINPENLGHKKDYAKNYPKLKKTYSRDELSIKIKGKEVKYWKYVYMADDSEGDEFIPIFYKRRKK